MFQTFEPKNLIFNFLNIIQVTITIESTGTEIVLLQKEFTIKPKTGASTKYKPGEWPPHCNPPLDNIEIMSVGLFLIVRIKDPANPKFIKYEVRDRAVHSV